MITVEKLNKRVNRLKKELDMDAPNIIIMMELRLIQECIDKIREDQKIKCNNSKHILK